jgi:hypothetical protein
MLDYSRDHGHESEEYETTSDEEDVDCEDEGGVSEDESGDEEDVDKEDIDEDDVDEDDDVEDNDKDDIYSIDGALSRDIAIMKARTSRLDTMEPSAKERIKDSGGVSSLIVSLSTM